MCVVFYLFPRALSSTFHVPLTSTFVSNNLSRKVFLLATFHVNINLVFKFFVGVLVINISVVCVSSLYWSRKNILRSSWLSMYGAYELRTFLAFNGACLSSISRNCFSHALDSW